MNNNNNNDSTIATTAYISDNITISTSTAKRRRSQNPIPFYKRLQIHKDYQVAVDALNFAPDDKIHHYFLSHFHADHYIGICKSWNKGTIFASNTTINLINLKFKTDRSRLVGMKINLTYHVKRGQMKQIEMDNEIDDGGYFVTLIDANHCPGAVLFLFESILDGTAEEKNEQLTKHDIWKLVNNNKDNCKHSTYRKYLKSCENYGYTINRILHTGDFRASGAMLKNPILGNVKLDKLYLDTTYFNPLYSFPAQKKVVTGFGEFVKAIIIDDCFSEIIDSLRRRSKGKYTEKGGHTEKKYQQRITQFVKNDQVHNDIDTRIVIDLTTDLVKRKHLICVGSYTIGKEKLVIEIAKLLDVKIYCDSTKRRIFQCFSADDDDYNTKFNSMITDDPYSTNLHIVGMRELQDLEKYFRPFQNKFRNVVGIRPTGWSYNRITSGNSYINGKKVVSTSKNGMGTKEDQIRRQQIIVQRVCEFWQSSKDFNVTESFARQFKNDKVSQVYELPYSEHSSFAELCMFLVLVNCKEVIPTVNLHNLDSIKEMKLWMDACESLRDSRFGNIVVNKDF